MIADTVWPNGARCAVVLSFDLDAETSWIFRDPANARRPVVISGGRFGPKFGVPGIIELLTDYGLPCSFFIPSVSAERYPEAVEQIVKAGYEIGAHGHMHERVDTLPPDQEEEILAKSLDILAKATGRKPVGYRSPSWELSPISLALLEKYGFVYSSNFMDDYFPYMHPPQGAGEPLVELPVSWLLDDAPFFQWGLGRDYRPIQPASNVLEIWREEFAGVYHRGGMFMLTMHPQLIGRVSRLDMLRRLIEYMRGFPNVWFTTAESVARHWKNRMSR
ncbi:MAG TPA: polysaccharide deacetylase [Alphaproteobacteria bacterium]|nr:polysaccharide deacetylase [Alphaproteobacteria bacterium]